MSPKELKSLVKTMRIMGVKRYRNGETEIDLTDQAPAPILKSKELSPEEEKEIKHKLEELTSVMQLDDKSLLDRLFPVTEQDAQDEQQ